LRVHLTTEPTITLARLRVLDAREAIIRRELVQCVADLAALHDERHALLHERAVPVTVRVRTEVRS